ncbi:hypothetical protein ACFFX0_27040 [Citricoccus parietis]|uniref:Uncharacterized protein n=1 Tax=Citricoccus parietis TaxID=592307 RepID=A0ABV5G6X4_9MICC
MAPGPGTTSAGQALPPGRPAWTGPAAAPQQPVAGGRHCLATACRCRSAPFPPPDASLQRDRPRSSTGCRAPPRETGTILGLGPSGGRSRPRGDLQQPGPPGSPHLQPPPRSPYTPDPAGHSGQRLHGRHPR